MNKQQELTNQLTLEFSPYFLKVENESHMHSANLGGDSHFKITLVSEKFTHHRAIARHRMIYQLLESDLKNGIHALALHLYTIKEWQDHQQTIPASTTCSGKNGTVLDI